MKVAINTRPLDGPWGGGNRFVQALSEALAQRGHAVAYELGRDVDLALIVDPRARNPQVTFTPGRILAHLARYPETIVVHRINECDERKNTRTMDFRLRLANYCADYTVFIASWLKPLNVWRRETPTSVIFNGGDESIFRRDSAAIWNGKEPLRLVTHHWGAHHNKGWDVYKHIDAALDEAPWRDRIAFTYIGNTPADIRVRNVTVRAPLDGGALACALAEHHAYLTASVNEPAGMHHVEGALIGLPVAYRRSGALPEYCTGFGEAFDGPEDVLPAIQRLMDNYRTWKMAMPNYGNTAARMTGAFVALFERLYAERKRIAAGRRLWRNPIAALATQWPL